MIVRIFLFFLFLPTITFGQTNQNLKKAYADIIPLHLEAVSGGQYIDPPVDIEGHPYLGTSNFGEGSVTINGLRYEQVSLLYNIWEDKLITFQPVHKQKIILNASKIDAFELKSVAPTQVVKWDANSGYAMHKNGLYEEVCNGKARLLAKHVKFTKPKNEAGKYSSTFVYRVDFFVEMDNNIYQITQKRQLFDLFGLDRVQMKPKMQEQQLHFKNGRKAYLAFLVNYFNQTQG